MSRRIVALCVLLAVFVLFLCGCDDDCCGPLIIDAPTGNDGFNDVTFLAGGLYTTNRELGDEIHNPVNLYLIDPATGEATTKYFLNMSDQGFLSITNDGESLYLLGGGHSIIVLNTLGEWVDARTTYPDFMDWRLAAGAYNTVTEELYFITERFAGGGTGWRAYVFDTETLVMTLSATVELVEDYFLASLEYSADGDEYYGIAFDEERVPQIVNLDSDFELIAAAPAPDTQVVGICRTATGWVLMTTDRRVLDWTP